MSALTAIPFQTRPPRPALATSPTPSTSAASPTPAPAPTPAPVHHDPLADSLLSAVAAGNQSLTQIAAAHNIPFPQFSLWLLKPETQQRLTDLSRAVASATRLSATAALPEVVHFLKQTLAEAAAPGPRLRPTLFPIEYNERELPTPAQVFNLRRQRVGLSASYLLLRLARLPDPASAGAPAPAPAPHRPRDQSAPSSAPSSPRPSFSPNFQLPPLPGMQEPKPSRPLALTAESDPARSDNLPRGEDRAPSRIAAAAASAASPAATGAASPPSQPFLPAIHTRSQEPRDPTGSGTSPIRVHPCNPWPAFPAATPQRNPVRSARADHGSPLSMLSRAGSIPAASSPRSPPSAPATAPPRSPSG